MNFILEGYDAISIRDFLVKISDDVNHNNPSLTLINIFVDHKNKEIICITNNPPAAIEIMAHSITDILNDGVTPYKDTRKQINKLIEAYNKLDC